MPTKDQGTTDEGASPFISHLSHGNLNMSNFLVVPDAVPTQCLAEKGWIIMFSAFLI